MQIGMIVSGIFIELFFLFGVVRHSKISCLCFQSGLPAHDLQFYETILPIYVQHLSNIFAKKIENIWFFWELFDGKEADVIIENGFEKPRRYLHAE